MQVEYYYSDDYAGMNSGKYKFYFGYESVDENDEWCFTVNENGVETFKINESYIIKNTKHVHLDRPTEFLTAGIGIWMLLK